MTRTFMVFFIVALIAPLTLAQTQIGVDIYGNQAAQTIRVAVPFPELAPGVDAARAQNDFFSPFTRDLAFSQIFTIVALPPNARPNLEVAKRASAQAFIQLSLKPEETEVVIEARLLDVATGSVQFGRRYRGRPEALTRVAHTIANDLVRFFNGKPGVFLTQIAFVSDRDGSKEIYLMDYDGANQRRVTSHRSITLSPSWAPDDERLAYTSFSRKTSSDLYIVNRRGGGRIRLETRVGLNTSPSFSPNGREIAFVGSIDGNPDIYVVSDDGKNVRRLTTGTSIESTPSWSPTGRQIAFTSSRGGTPQIFIMDAEGTNVRRVSFDGDWNDDAVFSPQGDLLAYTSRVRGGFQIRILNIASGESRILAGEGSNEQPSWSPDGRSLVFMSDRSGRWQIYRINVDGTGLTQLTDEGNNSAPDWSRKLE